MASATAGIFGKGLPEDSDVIGSPMKKARPSIGDVGDLSAGGSPSGSFPTPSALGDILAKAQASQASQDQAGPSSGMKVEEEL